MARSGVREKPPAAGGHHKRPKLARLDELGHVPFSRTGADLPSEVVGRACERASLIVTTNLPFGSWTAAMGGERSTGALLDRLTHRLHILSGRVRSASQQQKLSPPRGKIQGQEDGNSSTASLQGGITPIGR
jgi:hypothetical protein